MTVLIKNTNMKVTDERFQTLFKDYNHAYNNILKPAQPDEAESEPNELEAKITKMLKKKPEIEEIKDMNEKLKI